MNVTAVSLAELVNRGIIAIKDADKQPEQAPAAAAPAAAVSREMPRRPRSQSANAMETAHILDCADRLVQRIKGLAVNSEDPNVLRRHVLHGVESFLREITSKRPTTPGR